MADQQAQPQSITLDSKNSIEILSQFIDVANKNGTFTLAEADILNRARGVLLKGTQDNEINESTGRNLFIQAITKGQSKGSYSLEEASILHQVCTFVSSNLQAPLPPVSQETTPETSDDLSELSDPVPLRGPKIL
jgi:hypothetical protein